jgi:hypothetical protein
VVAVVGGLELDIHEVDSGGRGADKRHEHHQEQDLRLAGDAGARARLPDLGIRPRHHTHRMLTFAQSSVADPDPCVFGSVADPDPNPDPTDSHVFRPPESRSFYQHAKIVRKPLIPTILLLSLTFYL